MNKKSTPKQIETAALARDMIKASRYADQFKSDPEATIQDVVTDLLHLAAITPNISTPDTIARMALAQVEPEAEEEGASALWPKDGYYVTTTGVVIEGTLEELKGVAEMTGVSMEDPESDLKCDFAGNTDVDWDSQVTVVRDGQRIFVDANGLEWPEYELLWISHVTPERGLKLDGIELREFMHRHPGVVEAMRRTLKLKAGGVTNAEQLIIALQATKTTPLFRKYRQTLKKAIWSWKYRLGTLDPS